jgi:hypothetical protein
MSAISRSLTGLLSRRGRKSRDNPYLDYPDDSTGKPVGLLGGRDQCFEAAGPVKIDWEKVLHELKNVLVTYSPPVPGLLTFELYMIGRSKETAAPTIMFFHHQSGPRKEAVDAVRKSGLLKRYPGFRVGHVKRISNSKVPLRIPQTRIQ